MEEGGGEEEAGDEDMEVRLLFFFITLKPRVE